ncbi:MAG: BrnT family toxin [Chitinispirillaceae bacterium]|nr:BrnT family toxin [Chitinispirillaceae bacterium]
MPVSSFEWDESKNEENIKNHGISFDKAQDALFDPNRKIAIDIKHSTKEETRYYCFGKVDKNIVTVRFTYRVGKIRIFGAGYWRKGKKEYEKKN